ncbi:MAG TPA: hypothetical protein VK151_13890 [Fluviicola sp.]|nr:hypothetical protein [Fluviicola sp.]
MKKAIYYPDGKLKRVFFEDEKGVKQGKDLTFFPNGNVKELIYYSNGKSNGYTNRYYESGELKDKGKFRDGVFVDTMFSYRKNGSLEVYSIFDDKSQELKNVFFYPNGNVFKVRTYFVGSGEMNAIVEFTEDGKLKDGYLESKFVRMHASPTDGMIDLDFVGESQPNDSIVFKVLKDPKDTFEVTNVMRREKLVKTNPKMKILDSDYINGKANILLEVYNVKSGMVNILPYQVQLDKSKGIPKNNVNPIW